MSKTAVCGTIGRVRRADKERKRPPRLIIDYVAEGSYKAEWDRDAKEILFRVTSGTQLQAAHSLAKRMGFKVIGGSYVKETH